MIRLRNGKGLFLLAPLLIVGWLFWLKQPAPLNAEAAAYPLTRETVAAYLVWFQERDSALTAVNHAGNENCQSCHTPPDSHYAGQCSNCHYVNSWSDARWLLFIPLLSADS